MSDLDIIVKALRDEADDLGLTGTALEDRLEELLSRVAGRIVRIKRESRHLPPIHPGDALEVP